MRRFLLTFWAVICCLVAWAVDYEVVPLPQRVENQKGAPFVLNAEVRIVAPEGLRREAAFLHDYLQELTGLDLSVISRREKKERCIALSVSPKVSEKEGYLLTVSQRSVTIEGGSAAGVFYGIQTLRKSIGGGTFQELPAVMISDAPRFSWRGMHLDCSRHFFPVPFVKKFIDLLAMHNMNIFHWHITDDQGWRIEIEKWPKLVSVGSQRTGTIIGTNSDIDDEQPYGGYYT